MEERNTSEKQQPYSSPELVEYGTIQELTTGDSGALLDGATTRKDAI